MMDRTTRGRMFAFILVFTLILTSVVMASTEVSAASKKSISKATITLFKTSYCYDGKAKNHQLLEIMI